MRPKSTEFSVAGSEFVAKRLRQGLTEQLNAQPHPYLKVGRRVRVVSGPLTGLEGIIVRKKNHLRFVISLNLIMRSVSVELDDADIVPTP